MKNIEVAVPKRLILIENKPLIPEQDIEVRLLELIKYNQYGDDSTIKEITNVVLNGVYKTENVIYPFKEIESFYNFKEYINSLSDKIDTVNMFILNKVDNPFVIDYAFLRWENDNAMFNVTIAGEEDVTDKK